MKYALLVGDGMADYPLQELDGRTPLEVARTPRMDDVARRGQLGLVRTIPEGLAPGSDIGNLALLGYDPCRYFTGRAPLEAANLGIDIGEGEVAFRCNLVTINDGMMEDFSAGHVSTEEASELVDALNERFAGSVKFYLGTSYRHVAIFGSESGDAGEVAHLAEVECTPPHDITGTPTGPHLPKGTGSSLLVEIMTQAADVVSAHSVTEARRAAGKKPVTGIWLWGQGRAPDMPTLVDRFGISGAVISAVDLVKGIGKCAGLEVVVVPGATGYFDTNYLGKGQYALDVLDRHDFVYVHVEPPDEAAHEGLIDRKIQCIETFDELVVGTVLDGMSRFDEYRVLVTSDHATSLEKKTHVSDPVPFAFAGCGVDPNGGSAFDEPNATSVGLTIEQGYKLMNAFLRGRVDQ